MIAKMLTAEAPIKKTDFSRKVRRGVFGIGLHSWEQLMLLSLGVAGLIAIAVFVTTAAVVILQRHETAEANRELEEYKLSVESKVADAKKEGIEAGKAAGGALLKAAQANERAAKAELELARYRSGRSVTPEQHRILVQWLSMSHKGRVIVKPNFLNSEATRFANQISSAFNESGFSEVGDAPLQIVSYNRAGLFLAVLDGKMPPPHMEPTLRAFLEAGISLESGHGERETVA
jgi:hypothetical protein